MRFKAPIWISAALVLLITAPAQAETAAKYLFGAKKEGSLQVPQPIGSYAEGCMAGGLELVESGPRWQAMRLSRNRNWGQPELIRFIHRLSLSAVAAGWKGIYVGDLSQPRGGPMLSGHASHQIGLDGDFWMLPAMDINLSRQAREELSSISVLSADRKGVNSNWTGAHFEVLKAAASDPAVARIFVNAGIKRELCASAGEDRDWLRRIRPWYGHHYHFHVRLHCPEDAAECEDQAPPPPGDGCDASLEWWVSDAVLNPPPPDPNAPKPKPTPPLTLSGLPKSCEGVLAAQ